MNLAPRPVVVDRLQLVAIIVHLPSGPVRVPAEEIVEYNPAMPAVSRRDPDGLLHTFIGCPLETLFLESAIARVA